MLTSMLSPMLADLASSYVYCVLSVSGKSLGAIFLQVCESDEKVSSRGQGYLSLTM
jgi:hypothetical protein